MSIIDFIHQQQNPSMGSSDGIGALGPGNSIYPQSRMDKTQYATPSQLPTSADVISSDYDPKTDAYTGMPQAKFADGGITAIRFEKGGKSIFKDDPNNFAADVTKAYTTLFGRDPSEKELRANVDALNRDPDAYAFIVRQLSDSPEVDEAIKAGKIDLAPRTVMSGEDNVEVPGKDAAVTDLLSGYGKFTPTPEPGGLAGFANKIGPYAPFIAATAAMAAPYLAGAAATEGALAGGTAAGADVFGGLSATGSLAGTAGSQLTAAEIAALNAAGATTAAGGTAASAAYPGMSAELAAELGLAGSSSGLSTAGASGDVLANMGIEAAEKGITAKQALGAKMAMDMATKVGENAFTSPYSTGPSSTTTPLVFNPNVNRASTPGIAPMGAGQQYGQLYDTKANTYKYYAQGGITNLARGGGTDLGGYSDGGHLLRGPGDGMSDHIPATIGGKQPARLADGEFVIPADVVSHLGNGSTDAGAKQLYKMMDRIRKARTGRKQQGKKINPDKYMIKG